MERACLLTLLKFTHVGGRWKVDDGRLGWRTVFQTVVVCIRKEVSSKIQTIVLLTSFATDCGLW